MTEESMIARCEVFNEKHPVGSPVTVILDFGQKKETTVKYPAEVMGGHTAVAWVDGISGAYDLKRII